MEAFKKYLFAIFCLTLLSVVAAANFAADDMPFPPLEEKNLQQGAETRGFVSATFGTNMVLQRDQHVPIWGYATVPGTVITTKMILLNDGDNESSTPLLQRLETTARDDGFWRQILPPQPASLSPISIIVESSGDDEAVELSNILFGDVYICGGQSNMEFDLSQTTNATEEIAAADKYPHIRIFTVGKGTKSNSPLQDLQTIEQTWSVASSKTVAPPEGPKGFRYFSSVCWFFGKTIAENLDNQVPLGLISNNWGGTNVEQWSSSEAFGKCGREGAQGALYNAMIHPYTVGPMALTGFTWYQGEANAKGGDSADWYSCLFPAMIESWRKDFKPDSPDDLYFGFVQLSTWCVPGTAIPELRNAQMTAYEKLNHIGYSTNADHGAGCNIHPPTKQPCAKRLGRSALALQYKRDDLVWRSPSYVSASTSIRATENGLAVATAVIDLADVGDDGLYMVYPYNYMDGTFDCAGKNAKASCAWAGLQLSRDGWVNATVTVSGNQMILSANVVSTPSSSLRKETQNIIGTSYGWGGVPMLSVYRAGGDLPVLPWNRSLAGHGSVVEEASMIAVS